MLRIVCAACACPLAQTLCALACGRIAAQLNNQKQFQQSTGKERVVKATVTAMMVLLLFGCARFQGNEVSNNHVIVPNNTGSPRLITYNIEGNVENKNEEYLKEIASKYGYKLEWGRAKNNGTPHLEINFSFRRNGAAVVPAILTGLTLYAIPSWQTQKYELKTQLTDGNGIDQGFKSNDHTTLVQWLPMIFAFPFAVPFTAEEKLTERMYQDLMYKINQDLKGS